MAAAHVTILAATQAKAHIAYDHLQHKSYHKDEADYNCFDC